MKSMMHMPIPIQNMIKPKSRFMRPSPALRGIVYYMQESGFDCGKIGFLIMKELVFITFLIKDHIIKY